MFLIVKHFQNVVVSKKQIERNRPLKRDELYVDRRDVSHLRSYFTAVDDLVGKSLGHTVRPLQVIEESHLGKASSKAGPVLVKRRDAVKLVVRAGGILSVSVVGEALEDGRVGEMIRVRNVDSNSIVLGRVISQDKVEVPL